MNDTILRHLRQSRPFDSLELEVFLGLQLAADRTMAPWARVLRERASLTPAQYNVLRVLRGAGAEGRTVGGVAERLLTRSPDITRLIDRLVACGLVSRERDCTDRRAMRVRITAEGLERIAPLDELATAEAGRVLGRLSGEQLGVLRGGLAALLDAVESFEREIGAQGAPDGCTD